MGMIHAMRSVGRRSEPPITVLLVDGDAMFRHGIRGLLEEVGIRIAGEAHSAEEAVAQAVELAPDVVLMAVRLRGASGIEATRRIRAAVAEARVLILTNSIDSAHSDGAIRAGACGYVLKDDSPDEIVAAIRAAAAGESPLSPRVATGLLGRLRTEPENGGAKPELTARERTVLELLAAGRRNTQIAEDLAISIHTVKRHVSHLFEKLEVENRTQAAAEAMRRGLL
jgi:DNA-binding NarL/FixJ family response regulator